MTYKAGDKVWYNNRVETVEYLMQEAGMIKLYGFELPRQPDAIRPATAVEIAKQAVLDEVNDRSDSVSPILNELLDVLIAKVAVHTMGLAIETYREANTPVPEYKTGWTEQKEQTAVVGEKDGIERVINNNQNGNI